MGIDITVLVVDWAHLVRIPPDERLTVLQQPAYADDDSDDSETAAALPRLSEPYARLAAAPGRRTADFEEFTGLLSGWAEVVREAERRHWGLIGLPL
ncbi:hypothetical protein [Streptomyces sp. NPDC090445]|uniref:hypothetical protein n=1 Tax=Streptomyces sp. NPDC090445 TaxID=3365963 RepID=UPI0038262567